MTITDKIRHHPLIIWVVVGFLILNLTLVGIIFWLVQNQPDTTYQSIEPDMSTTTFLRAEELVVVEAVSEDKEPVEVTLPVKPVQFEYIEVTDSCDIHYEGECLLVRSGPGTDYDVVERLRNDVVLKVGGQVERDGQLWYRVVFDEWLRYPERVEDEWYVTADYVKVLLDEGDKTLWEDGAAEVLSKRIVIECNEQTLYAYEGAEVVLETPISTGLDLTPTPLGNFTVFKKTPSRYMQGPLPGLPSDQYYDMPGVPWNLYFTHGGAVIHGAYWHDSFGSTYSHGCVNLPPDAARELYQWAELGTEVIVR